MGVAEERKSPRDKKGKQEVELTPQEKRLLNYFRHDLQYGEVVIIVKRGQPVFIRQTMKEVKLD